MSDRDERRDLVLSANLSGALAACAVGTFQDVQLRRVITQWINLCRTQGREPAWSGAVFNKIFQEMKKDSAPEVVALVRQLSRMFHEGEWAPREGKQ
jgi:hypothetical protein